MSTISSPDKVRALSVALAVLRGIGGGYSPKERDAALKTLDAMYNEAYQEAVSGSTGS